MDFQTPETIYENLLGIYKSGDFDELLDKAESFRVLLSGTTVQSKFDLLMANYEGRINGREVWEKTLKNISSKYPDSPEALRADQIIKQIQQSDSIEKLNKTYLNYKWIFAFDVQDTIALKNTKTKLEQALKEIPYTRWFLSEDRFDLDQTYLVLHGIRSRRDINEWKKKFEESDNEVLNTNNFVVLSADYRKMLLDKTHFNNEK